MVIIAHRRSVYSKFPDFPEKIPDMPVRVRRVHALRNSPDQPFQALVLIRGKHTVYSLRARFARGPDSVREASDGISGCSVLPIRRQADP